MIYIIVPTFARVEDTEIFLRSISDNVNDIYSVLLIDDHPDKPTLNAFKDKKNVKVYASEKELWWVGCINFGIRLVIETFDLKSEDIIVFANNDVEIETNCFDILKKEIQKNKYQILHPRTFNQDGVEVSSGSKILTFFPYLSFHPKGFKKYKKMIDMGTARFLITSGSVLKKVGYVNKNLLQYGGDNDFTLSAKRMHGIKTYIIKDAICRLNDTQTGLKNHNMLTIKQLYQSFFSLKSPNNIKYRFILFKKFFGNVGSFFITLSLTLNTILKFILKKWL
jgi:GT2 family glycosyltransferase